MIERSKFRSPSSPFQEICHQLQAVRPEVPRVLKCHPSQRGEPAASEKRKCLNRSTWCSQTLAAAPVPAGLWLLSGPHWRPRCFCFRFQNYHNLQIGQTFESWSLALANAVPCERQTWPWNPASWAWTGSWACISLSPLWVALVVKNLPANAGDIRDAGSIPTSVRSPWRMKWQPIPIFLSGKIPWTEEPGSYSPWGLKSRTRLKQLSTPGVQGPHTPSLLPGHPCASLPGPLGVSHAALAVSGQISGLSHTRALS